MSNVKANALIRQNFGFILMEWFIERISLVIFTASCIVVGTVTFFLPDFLTFSFFFINVKKQRDIFRCSPHSSQNFVFIEFMLYNFFGIVFQSCVIGSIIVNIFSNAQTTIVADLKQWSIDIMLSCMKLNLEKSVARYFLYSSVPLTSLLKSSVISPRFYSIWCLIICIS